MSVKITKNEKDFIHIEAPPAPPIPPSKIKVRSNFIVWENSDDCLAECKINWNLVRAKMNDWVRENQNPECQDVFFYYNENICKAFEKKDCPPKVDPDLVEYHNLGDDWHGFLYPKDDDDNIPEIRVLLLDSVWEWIMDRQNDVFDVGIEAFEFGRSMPCLLSTDQPKGKHVFVKFKVVWNPK